MADRLLTKRVSKRLFVQNRFVEPSVRLSVVPIKSDIAILRVDVAVKAYPPDEFPTNTFPYDGTDESPVPPYTTPMDVVAETTPFAAVKGPFAVPKVNAPFKVVAPEKMFVFEKVFDV